MTSTQIGSIDMAGEPTTFVDTNILVYAHDATEAEKQPVAQALLEVLWAGRTGVLSTQVLQEFYAVVTRKLATPMTRSQAREIIEAYAAWPVVIANPDLILAATQLEESHQLSFWDALIVESARVGGATRLLTEDMQAGRVIEGIRIENPFVEQRRVSETQPSYGASGGSWDDADLLAQLSRYEEVCRAAGMRRNAIHSYWDYARRFLAWRVGDYQPRGATGSGRPVPIGPVGAADLERQAASYAGAIEAAGRAPATVDTYHRHAMLFIRWLRGDFEPGRRATRRRQ